MPTVVLLEFDALDSALAGRAAAPGLLPAAGRPLAYYAAQAFRACGDVDRIALVGPSAYQQHPEVMALVDELVPLDGSVAERCLAALDRFRDSREVVLWPTNGPLLTPAMVEAFLRGAPLDAGLNLAVVRERRVRAMCGPDDALVAQVFAGEHYAVAPLLACRPAVFDANRDALRRVLQHETFSLEKVLGMGVWLKYKAGRASLQELALRLGEVLGAPCVIQILPYPELTLRVYNRAQHHLVKARLETL